jgi:UDP-GlcNAc:undecaprenyl-phosphate/decaprenyl-phosphate GlcNAc-1-phosphate transferase
MENNIFFYISLFTLNILIFFFFDKVASSLKVYDIPDKIRKFHKKKTPVIGGYIIIVNLILIFFLNSLLQINLLNFFQNNTGSSLLFITCSTLVFILGAYDDKFLLSANKKLFFLALIVSINIYYDEFLHLSEIRFSFTNYIIPLRGFSQLFTLLCFLLFINALNMFDGINFQAGFYAFLILVYLFFLQSVSFFSLAISFGIIIFLILNLTNKIFLGDSGTYLLSFIFSYCFVKLYNFKEIMYSDQIFFIMLVPGLELLRLSITRIIKKRHPFSADRMHIHHLLSKIFGANRYLIFISIFMIINIFLAINIYYNFYFIIIMTFFYLLLIYNKYYSKNLILIIINIAKNR